MDVQCKVVCNAKNEVFVSAQSRQCSVRLNPVYGDSPENKTWSQYTPSGLIELQVTNPTAIDAFELGGEYLVTFSKVTA